MQERRLPAALFKEDNNSHPAVRLIWSYRRVAVYGSGMCFFGLPTDFLTVALRQFYAGDQPLLTFIPRGDIIKKEIKVYAGGFPE